MMNNQTYHNQRLQNQLKYSNFLVCFVNDIQNVIPLIDRKGMRTRNSDESIRTYQRIINFSQQKVLNTTRSYQLEAAKTMFQKKLPKILKKIENKNHISFHELSQEFIFNNGSIHFLLYFEQLYTGNIILIMQRYKNGYPIESYSCFVLVPLEYIFQKNIIVKSETSDRSGILVPLDELNPNVKSQNILDYSLCLDLNILEHVVLPFEDIYCQICFNEEKEGVTYFHPCNHNVCQECSLQFRECPFCKLHIDKVVKHDGVNE